ncbi:hypothetical protein Aperf_G00000014405 [Anoplocephala perfoliata]
MSDAEKLVEAGVKYPDDPLILRPQVGGDILRSHPSGRLCWPRSFILRFMLICILMATIAGCILIIFALHHSGAWPWSHFHRRYASAAGSCRVFTPFPDIGVEERYLYEPNAITITHGPVAGFPAASTFHLLKEAISVMRTLSTCYVYPLDPEIAEAVPVDDSVIERIKEARNPGMTQLKSPFGMRLFMISPGANGRIQIKHPAAAANCSDVPTFRLVEMVLSQTGAQLDPVSEAAFSPTICSKECTLGVSRDNPGISRQVCRCPPRATPPSVPLPQFGEDSFSEDEKDPDQPDGGDADSFQQSLDFQVNDNQEAANSSAPVDASKEVENALEEEEEEVYSNLGPLLRSQRSIDAMHEMQGPVGIPSDCTTIDEVLEGAVPNSQKHALLKMTIVKC